MLLIIGVVAIVLLFAGIRRVVRRATPPRLGPMSEQWLAERRTARLS